MITGTFRPYEPRDHYWIVAGDESRVWSSAHAAYVPAEEETYATWRASGGTASRIANEVELADVLHKAKLPSAAPGPFTPAELIAAARIIDPGKAAELVGADDLVENDPRLADLAKTIGLHRGVAGTPSLADQLAQAKAGNEALRAALVKGGILTEQAIAAEKAAFGRGISAIKPVG